MPDELSATPITAQLMRGALDLEQTVTGLLPHRLPAWARDQCDDGQLAMAEAQPSGVRLALRTSASVVELETLRTRMAYVGNPPRPDGVYDLLVDGRLADQRSVSGGHTCLVDLGASSTELIPGPTGVVRFADLPAGTHDLEIWLPHTERTELVALRSDAPIGPVPADGRPVWVHHGSSISHGSNAASPTTTWPAVAAAGGGADLVNWASGAAPCSTRSPRARSGISRPI